MSPTEGPAGRADTHGSDGRLLPVPSGWVSDVGPQKDDRLLEHWRPAGGTGGSEALETEARTVSGPLMALAPPSLV